MVPDAWKALPDVGAYEFPCTPLIINCVRAGGPRTWWGCQAVPHVAEENATLPIGED